MPTLLRKRGYRFLIYTNEGKEPPHIHVIEKGGEIKVWLESYVIAYSYGISSSDRKKILSIIRENDKFFLEKWKEIHG